MHILAQERSTGDMDILAQAVREIEFYRTLFSNNKEQAVVPQLSEFPFLTRKTIQRERSRMLCERYQYYPNIGYLLIKRSFGLTGIPLEVYWDSRDDFRAQESLWKYRKERFDVTADNKCCVFRVAEYAGNKIKDYMPWYISQDGKTLSFSMRNLSPEYMQSCLDVICAYEPEWMVLPPSVALMLAETMVKDRRSFPPSMRYIELCGEMLDLQTDTVIRDMFHVPIANVYGTQEMGAIAASCEHGHLHIFSENVLVEVIVEGKSVVDGEGDIYITSLQNTSMPLIRLNTGDRGVLQSEPCTCGQQTPILRLTRGRDCGFIRTISGRKVSGCVLRSLAEYTNEEVSRCLAQIQFRQKDVEHMDIILSTKPAFFGWEKEVVRVFCEKIMDSELRQMHWNFIPLSSYDPGETEGGSYLFFK